MDLPFELSLGTDTVVLLEMVRFNDLGSVNISYPGAATLLSCMSDDCGGIKDRGILLTVGHEPRMLGMLKDPLDAESRFEFLLGGSSGGLSPVQSFQPEPLSNVMNGLWGF